MLGLTRLFLALAVVVTHVYGGWGGVLAVYGFYMLSGFLITRVLNDVYRFSFIRFALNRVLRLFPMYFVVAGTTLAMLKFVPGFGHGASAFVWKGNAWDVFANIFLLPMALHPADFRLVPPTWSIGIELANYLMLWALFAKRRSIALLGIAIGASAHLMTWFNGMPWEYRYGPIYASLLPFSLGAMAYFLCNSQPISRLVLTPAKTARKSFIGVALMTFALCSLISIFQITSHVEAWNFPLYFYGSQLLMFLLLLANEISARTNVDNHLIVKSDKLAGDLAYPLFLVHIPVALLVGSILNLKAGFELLLFSIVPIIVVSLGLVKMQDFWIEKFRDRVRGSGPRAVFIPSVQTS